MQDFAKPSRFRVKLDFGWQNCDLNVCLTLSLKTPKGWTPKFARKTCNLDWRKPFINGFINSDHQCDRAES